MDKGIGVSDVIFLGCMLAVTVVQSFRAHKDNQSILKAKTLKELGEANESGTRNTVRLVGESIALWSMIIVYWIHKWGL